MANSVLVRSIEGGAAGGMVIFSGGPPFDKASLGGFAIIMLAIFFSGAG